MGFFFLLLNFFLSLIVKILILKLKLLIEDQVQQFHHWSMNKWKHKGNALLGMCDHQLGVFTEGLGVPLKMFVSNEAAGVWSLGIAGLD